MRKVASIVFLTLLFMGVNKNLHSQDIPNTYALIFGVAKYEHPNIKHLKYADDDALAFKSMLQSTAGGNVPDENIKCFVNDKATSSNFYGSRRWLRDAPKAGDRVIFFFSGHGDAEDPDLVYLLTYDTDASDPTMYGTGAIPVSMLKGDVRKLKEKGCEVILITDACRTNELASSEGNSIYAVESIIQRNFGEIVLNSCSADQESAEDVRWGGGHGVFTHYLLQGWMGMANDDEDDFVTVGELFSYVKKMVKKDRRIPGQTKTLQIPYHCCSEFEDIIISKVDHSTLKKLKEIEEGIVIPDDMYAYVTTKSGSDVYDEDSITMQMYNNIIASIEEGNILNPIDDCAYYYYQQLENRVKDRPIFYDAQSELISALSAKGQEALGKFLNGTSSSFNSNMFKTGYEYMAKVLEIVEPEDYFFTMFKAKALFLESQYLMLRESTRQLAMDKIDSAITIQPKSAYLYYSKGLIYEKYLEFDSAISYYSVAINLAPKWSGPYEKKSDLLLELGKTDSAVACMTVLSNTSRRAITHLALGEFYYGLDSLDKAIQYYHKALEKDSSLVDAHNGLFVCYRFQGKDSLSRIYRESAESFSTDEHEFYDMYAAYYEKVGNYTKAADYYDYLYKTDTTNMYYRLKFAEMNFYDGETGKAEDIFIELLDNDPYYLETYYTIYELLKEKGEYESAIDIGKMLLEMDPGYNPASLYYPYFKLGMNDSAVYYLQLANKKFPNKRLTREYVAYNHLMNKRYAEAISVYEGLGRRYSKTASIFVNLAYCYDQMGQGAKCISAMEKALTADKYNIGFYQKMVNYLWDYDSKRQDKIVHWVMFPWHNFKFEGYDYVVFAAYHLTYTDFTDDLLTMCQIGLNNFPSDFRFDLYASIYHLKTDNKEAFYDAFKAAIEKGMTYDDFKQYEFILPDREKDKKYRKISKNLYPR